MHARIHAFSAGNILLAFLLVHVSSVALIGHESKSEESLHRNDTIDRILLEKVRHLYPDIRLQRENPGDAFFSSVKEVARVRLDNHRERVVIEVRVSVPAAQVAHGWGELLIFGDAEDTNPLVRRAMCTLPIVRESEIHLIENRWLQFGTKNALVSLIDENSINHFGEHGLGVLDGLSVCAARSALEIYVNEGREAFLERASIRKHRARNVHLPVRISRYEIYPSLVEDIRYSEFRYSDAWEGTVFVRLTPFEETQEPLILEIGTGASSAGVTCEQVDLLLWETRQEEPTDRPSPGK